jgi:hypothetical protein
VVFHAAAPASSAEMNAVASSSWSWPVMIFHRESAFSRRAEHPQRAAGRSPTAPVDARSPRGLPRYFCRRLRAFRVGGRVAPAPVSWLVAMLIVDLVVTCVLLWLVIGLTVRRG